MKLFLISISYFFAVILVIVICLEVFLPSKPLDANNFMAAMIDKHESTQQINQPKLILVGGSSMAFGINSEELEKQLGIPTVNLGLHAGLGLSFMLEEVKSVVKPNDIVILSPEYFLSEDGVYRLKKLTSNLYPESSKYYKHDINIELAIEIEKIKNNIISQFPFKSKPEFYKSADSLESKTNSSYTRKSFNKYGDHVAHLDSAEVKNFTKNEKNNYRYWEGIKAINRFYTFANDRNIKVYFSYPPYLKSEYELNIDAITKLDTDLRKDLKVKILNTPYDVVYPLDYFFDTMYHLNKRGREARTNQLLISLEKLKDFKTNKCGADLNTDAFIHEINTILTSGN